MIIRILRSFFLGAGLTGFGLLIGDWLGGLFGLFLALAINLYFEELLEAIKKKKK